MITLLLNISCQSYWSFNVWIRFYNSCHFDNSKTYVDVGVRVLFLSIVLMNFPRVCRNGKEFPESIKWSIKEKKLLWKYREKKYYFIPIEVGNFTLSVPLIISPPPMWMYLPILLPPLGRFPLEFIWSQYQYSFRLWEINKSLMRGEIWWKWKCSLRISTPEWEGFLCIYFSIFIVFPLLVLLFGETLKSLFYCIKYPLLDLGSKCPPSFLFNSTVLNCSERINI